MNTEPPPLSEQEQISVMAHRIYEEEGRPEGKADDHWARAERIIHEQRVGVSDPERSDGPSLTAVEPPEEMVP